MRDYELVTIVNPEVDDEGILAVVDKVNRFITERGGVVDGTEQWGRKKLAYSIKRFSEGSYSFTRFNLEPKAVKELEVNLRAEDEILRHLVTKAGE